MDSLTHSLVGVALSRGFFKRRVAYATWALVIAANLPDLDVLYSWPGIRTIEYHRGFLHSIWMLPVWSALLAFGLRWYVRRQPPRRLPGMERALPLPGFALVFGMGCAGVGSHLLLDWGTSFGERLLTPWRSTWYALDVMPTWDPWLWLILIAVLGVPMMLGLITNEVGTQRRTNPHRASGIVALLCLVAWFGLRSRQHSAALADLDSPSINYASGGELPLDWGAFPNLSTPFDWRAVVYLPSRVLVADVDSPWNTGRGRVRLQRLYIRPPHTDRIGLAEATSTARIFLHFARFPFADDHPLDNGGWMVTITDMRFAQGETRPAMHVAVEIDGSGQVLRQSFRWRRGQ